MPGSFKFILATLDPPRLFNTLCDPPRFSKQSWTPPDHFGPSQTVLVPLRPAWTLPDLHGPSKYILDDARPTRLFWTLTDRPGPSQTVLALPDRSGYSQTVQDPTTPRPFHPGPYQTLPVSIRPSWTHQDPDRRFMILMDLKWLSWHHHNPYGPSRSPLNSLSWTLLDPVLLLLMDPPWHSYKDYDPLWTLDPRGLTSTCMAPT